MGVSRTVFPDRIGICPIPRAVFPRLPARPSELCRLLLRHQGVVHFFHFPVRILVQAGVAANDGDKFIVSHLIGADTVLKAHQSPLRLVGFQGVIGFRGPQGSFLPGGLFGFFLGFFLGFVPGFGLILCRPGFLFRFRLALRLCFCFGLRPGLSLCFCFSCRFGFRCTLRLRFRLVYRIRFCLRLRRNFSSRFGFRGCLPLLRRTSSPRSSQVNASGREKSTSRGT